MKNMNKKKKILMKKLTKSPKPLTTIIIKIKIKILNQSLIFLLKMNTLLPKYFPLKKSELSRTLTSIKKKNLMKEKSL